MPITLPPDTELLNYLLSFDLFEKLGRPKEGEEYIKSHLHRFRKTLELLPQLTGTVRVLELGASPYFMTFLIQKYFGYKVDTANFFGDYRSPSGGEGTLKITSTTFHESHEYTYPIFNLESDPYPFPDNSFDIVLCCEIIEHLVMNPSHMLAEIHRILKPGGYLLLTTPNIASLKNAMLLLRGKNIQHHYSGYGIYGRHNREFTAKELSDLLKLHHFDVQITVDDAYPSPKWIEMLTQLQSFRGYRDNLFALCQARPEPCFPRYPQWLYSHLWGDAIKEIVNSGITMGEGEEPQLGEGWHGLENWPPNIRWTEAEAIVRLKVPVSASRLILVAASGPAEALVEIWQDSTTVGEFSLSTMQEVELALPQDLLNQLSAQGEQILSFKIKTLNPFRPSETGLSQDHRLLGIALHSLKVI